MNVGGTTTTVVRGDDTGKILERRAFATDPARGAEPLYGEIATITRATLTPQTRAIGVAIGGPLDARRGAVIKTPHLPFVDFPMRDRLAADCALPVRVHHDAAACALAEWRWGPDAGAAGLAYLTCGTGFGVGLVLDGRVRYGSTGHSPELGHIRYRDDGPDIFGKPGCYEGFGSATALALLARRRNPARFADVSPSAIAALATSGNPVAAQIVADNEAAVGAACALLADLLVLDVIVLGSLAHYLGPPWIAGVRTTFEREALAANAAHCRLRAPMEDVQDLSGLAAAIETEEGR